MTLPWTTTYIFRSNSRYSVARIEPWRLTRNRYGRALYDWLAAHGFSATRMYRYRRSCDGSTEVTPPPDVHLSVVSGDTDDPVVAEAELATVPADSLLLASVDDVTVGYGVLSDRPVHVDALGRTVDVQGAYLWRLFVDPAHRSRGIASALVGRGLAEAADWPETPSVSALVAADNVPSRRTFEKLGFSPVERLEYCTAFGREWRRRRSIAEQPAQ